MKKLIVLLMMLTISTSVSAAEIPPESLPSNASFECMEYTESLISDILAKVHNGLGFSDAQAEARRRFFTLVVSGQSNGYSFSQLSEIASNAIFQYRDMYLRPEFYTQNEDKVRMCLKNISSAESIITRQRNEPMRRYISRSMQALIMTQNLQRILATETFRRSITVYLLSRES